MNRWIGKVLAVLLVLLCILPVAAAAAEYQVGDTLWTAGEEPTADTEQYSRWIPVIRSDGVQEYREVGTTGTYEYQWIVEEYYGPGKKEGIPTSFAVKNVDQQGEPMVGTEFILFEERGDNLLLIASAVTNEEGVAYLNDLCLDDNGNTAVWHLVQTNFPESEMAETHYPYTGMWDIYVTRDSGGVHTLEMVPSPAAQTMTLGMDDVESEDYEQTIDVMEESGQELVEENYNEQENVITVVNEKITGRLSLYVDFEDGIVPDGMEAFSVDVTFPDGSVETVIVSKQRPQIRLINIPLGQYFIEEQTDDIQAEGYALKTKYAVALVGENPVEGQIVTFTEEKTAATVTITNCYEEIKIANTILAKVMDENGNPLDGAELELLDSNDNLIRTVGVTSEKGTFVFDDLAEYAVKGEKVTFKIRQSKVPIGYIMSEDQFIITVEKKNGEVTVSAKRDAGLLARLFRSGKETGPNGETIIKFVNEADLGNLSIKIVNEGVDCPIEEVPITVKGLNYQTQATLSEHNDWQIVLEDLPKSEYTIIQNADAKGYVLVDKYTVSGGFVTGNRVELASENTEVTITNTYSLEGGKLHVQMTFVEDVIPDTVTKIPVTVTGTTAYTKEAVQKTVDLTATNNWQTTLDLPLGEYDVTQDVSGAQAEGYEFTPDTEQKKIALKTGNEEQICTIANRYMEIQEPILEKIIIQVMDVSQNPIAGATVGLFHDSDSPLKEFGPSDAGGQIIIDGLESYMDIISSMLEDGERENLTLRQTIAPEDYELSENVYKIFVEKTGEEISYGVEGVNTSGTEVTLTFTNNAATPEELEIPGKVVIQSKDQNGNPIAGCTIGLYMDGDRLPKSFPATDADGQIVIDDLQGLLDRYGAMLPEGETRVVLKQDKVPEGYEATATVYDIVVQNNDGEISYEIPGADINTDRILFTFANNELNAVIPGKVVVKVQDQNGNPVQGATIGLYMDGEKLPKSFPATDADGQIVIDDLQGLLDRYGAMLPEGETKVTLQQAELPEGYEAATTVYDIVVQNNGGEISYEIPGSDINAERILLTFTNNVIQLEKIIIQVMDVSQNPIAGATVGLFHDSDSPLKEFGPSDAGGQIIIDGLESYMDIISSMLEDGERENLTLRQTIAPEDYELSENVYKIFVEKTGEEISYGVEGVNTSGTEVTLTFTNNAATPEELEIPGKVVIQSKDQNGNPIAGCTIGLYMDGDRLPKSFPATDADGQIVIDDLQGLLDRYGAMLPEGETRVVLKQDKVPEGYEATATVYDIVVQNNDGEISYEIPGADINTDRILFTFANNELNAVIPGKVVVKVQDQNGNPVQGATIGLYMDGEKLPKSFPATDADGQIVIDDLQGLLDRYGAMLPEGETKVTLQQAELPEGYEAATTVYDIVVQNNGGEISYEIPGSDINAERILLTFTNNVIQTEPAETGSLYIQVEFKDKPSTASITEVKVSVGSVVKNHVITEADGWQTTIDVPVGQYKITQSAVKATGYKVTTSYTQQNVTIDANKMASCVITNQFAVSTSDQNNSGSSSSRTNSLIGIRTLDSKGAPLAGAKYALYHGTSALRSFTDYGTGQINVENLDMLLGSYVNDPSVRDTPLTLQQTQPPIGGERCTKTYDVYISSATGAVNVKGSEIDANGVQLVDFIHEVKEEEQPNNNAEEKDPDVIVIRTVDESGNPLSGAEYCLSTDLRFDKDKDIVYSKADRSGEITIEDLEELLQSRKKATYYLMQSRQPDGGSLSSERFVVELSRKKGDLEVEVKKDASVLERIQGSGVEESTTGEWIVTFCSNAKTTTIQIGYEEVVDWHNSLEDEAVLQQFKKNEYEFQLNWVYAGEEKEPLSLKLSNGEAGSFDPIPYGASYEIVPVQEGCYKLEFTKGDLKGIAIQENVDLTAKVTYNIVQGEPLTLEMQKLDSRTGRPMPGIVYTLKNNEGDEIATYRSNGSGKLLIDAIAEPGEYTLTESEVPSGYKKLKKDIGISVTAGVKESTDEKGDPMIVQALEAVVTHSQVRQQSDGSYRIGTPQSGDGGKLPLILGAAAAVAVAAGAGTAVIWNKKKRGFKKRPYSE